MNVICMLSGNPGHLDFGGLGFVKLGRGLASRGHRVTWVAPARQQERLRQLGFRVDTSLPVDRLVLYPLLQPRDLKTYAVAYAGKRSALATIERAFRDRRPDLLLIDRILALAPLLAANLGIPAVVIGTNGEFCQRIGRQVIPSQTPVDGIREIGEILRRDLGWQSGELASFWGQSDFANLTFLGRTFYEDSVGGSGASWYLNHFGGSTVVTDRTHHGVSFGHSGDEDRMITAVEWLLRLACPGDFEIYCGSRDSVHARYAAMSGGPRVYQWVPFVHHFPRLRTLTFFGGMGTLWLGIEFGIPMLFVVGGIGDQLINAKRATRLTLAEWFSPDKFSEDKLASCWQRLASGDHARASESFKARDNFSHTMETAIMQLERFAALA